MLEARTNGGATLATGSLMGQQDCPPSASSGWIASEDHYVHHASTSEIDAELAKAHDRQALHMALKFMGDDADVPPVDGVCPSTRATSTKDVASLHALAVPALQAYHSLTADEVQSLIHAHSAEFVLRPEFPVDQCGCTADVMQFRATV